jgi:hypothetical protein
MTRMTHERRNHEVALSPNTLTDDLREAILARAARLGIDPTSVNSPSPHAVVARTYAGDLLRLDVSAYRSADLDR